MAITITAAEVEHYTQRMMYAYHSELIFQDMMMQYFGMRPAEVLNQPIVAHGNGSFYDDGSDHTLEDASIASVEIPLFTTYKLRNSIKQSQLDVRPDLRHLATVGLAHGQQRAQDFNHFCQNFLAKVADTAGNTHDVDENHASTAGALCAAAVQEIAAAMDAARVFSQGRYAVVAPSFFYKLGAYDGVVRKDFGGKANVQTLTKRTALEYLGFTIFSGAGFGVDYTGSPYNALGYPTAVSFDTGSGGGATQNDILGVFWQSDSWALREQTQPSVHIDPIPEKQIIQVLLRQMFGMKELLTDGIHSIYQA